MNNKETSTIMKLAETAILAALCYVSFTFLQIKIPVPGGDATSLHIGNAFCVLAALLLGGVYGGMAGAVGMTIADLMDPVYITGAPKTLNARPATEAIRLHLNTYDLSVLSLIFATLCATSPVIKPIHSFRTNVFGAPVI